MPAQLRDAILSAATPTPSLAGKTMTGARLALSKLLPAEGSGSGGSTNQPLVAAKLKFPRVEGDRFKMIVEGGAGQRYEIQASANFKQWTALGTVTNTSAEVEFSQPLSRAVAK